MDRSWFPRSDCAQKMIRVLNRLFLERLPPVPALNKWIASFPMLSWLTLGMLLHGIMNRVWAEAVLNLPGIIEERPGAAAAAEAEVADVGQEIRKPKLQKLF